MEIYTDECIYTIECIHLCALWYISNGIYHSALSLYSMDRARPELLEVGHFGPIIGHQRLKLGQNDPIVGHLWTLTGVWGHRLSSVDTNMHLRTQTVICGHGLSSVDIGSTG